MKKLNIDANSCMLLVNQFGVQINGKHIEDLLKDNLPNVDDYETVPARIHISVELLNTNLLIQKDGTEVKEINNNLTEADD